MPKVITMRCPRCSAESASTSQFYCADCGSILEAHVDVGHLGRGDFDRMRQSRDASIWRWLDFFPVKDASSIVSLGEGGTPLIHAKRLGER
ncbi:MAG TPA: hypothetical protein VEI95_04515, partial [Acidobacteriota bacterium]|nr:hypothetical protein [Acidobacteriota bacterium]